MMTDTPPRRPKRKTQVTRPSRASRLTDALILSAPSSFNAWFAKEPTLVFAGRRLCEDPKTGLSEFGPAALDSAPRTSIRIGLIGTGDTIQQVKSWIERANSKIDAGLNSKGRPYDPLLFPSFPGFSIDSPFNCAIEFDDQLTVTLLERELTTALSGSSTNLQIKGAVELFSSKLQVLADRELQPDLVICAIPKLIEQACRANSKSRLAKPIKLVLTKSERNAKRIREHDRSRGQGYFEFADHDQEEQPESGRFTDFHNSLKAHAMRSQLATQLIWESTLSGRVGGEDPATTAWNFFTALYYKAGNMPWEMSFSTKRTCFVGITFYRESNDPQSAMRTCLAQAFSETGDGLVLRGERLTWDRERDKKPHLNRDGAEAILRQVIALYTQHFGAAPFRVVVHKTSRFWPEETAGFKAALSDVQTFDFLAIERRGLRFLRLGKEPPIRGTVVALGPRNYLIYTRGYIPYLRQYPGMRIPNPLEVVEHIGDSSPERVCSEILALTKLNWNSCAFGSADPITIDFSREVGTIIKELPKDIAPMTKYKYYM